MSNWIERGLEHPDLAEVGTRLQARLDRILEAEREAAVILARRTSTLRDRLLDAEDAGAIATVSVIGGGRLRGRVAAVTVDHVELRTEGGTALVPLDAVIVITVE